MHNARSHEQAQAAVPHDDKPRPNEVVLSLFPGTLATYVPGELEEDPISPWYWVLLAALFLALGLITWTQEREERCLEALKKNGSTESIHP